MSDQQQDIEALVRRVVHRMVGRDSSPAARPLLDEETVRQLPAGSSHTISPDTIVTPLARQVALERRIRLVVEPAAPGPSASPNQPAAAGQKIVALGADHGGYTMKESLKKIVSDAGYGLIDCGTNSSEAVDYPDFAYAVARHVADGRAWRGIMIDGAGIGSCMVANKIPGVRAAMCYDRATAVNSREHNNANVLTLGAGLIGPALARQIVETWLATEFGGGRHAKRVDKIDAIEKRYIKRLEIRN
jgi:ribose 5-phosphate isomerase B